MDYIFILKRSRVLKNNFDYPEYNLVTESALNKKVNILFIAFNYFSYVIYRNSVPVLKNRNFSLYGDFFSDIKVFPRYYHINWSLLMKTPPI